MDSPQPRARIRLLAQAKQRVRLQPVAKPTPPVVETRETQLAEVLLRLNGILEYTHGRNGTELIRVDAVTPLYAKAVSNKRHGEYYFPLHAERSRRGVIYRVLSVLKKEDSSLPIEWSKTGQPLRNLILVDDMKTWGVNTAKKAWTIGLLFKDVRLILQEPRPNLVPRRN